MYPNIRCDIFFTFTEFTSPDLNRAKDPITKGTIWQHSHQAYVDPPALDAELGTWFCNPSNQDALSLISSIIIRLTHKQTPLAPLYYWDQSTGVNHRPVEVESPRRKFNGTRFQREAHPKLAGFSKIWTSHVKYLPRVSQNMHRKIGKTYH